MSSSVGAPVSQGKGSGSRGLEFRGLGSRGLGFRGLGSRSLGIRGLGSRSLGQWGLGYSGLGLGFRGSGLRESSGCRKGEKGLYREKGEGKGCRV